MSDDRHNYREIAGDIISKYQINYLQLEIRLPKIAQLCPKKFMLEKFDVGQNCGITPICDYCVM